MRRALAVSLRPAVAADCLALWRWRNDPETRRASFNQAEISLEDHSRWFEESLARPDRHLYIVQADGVDAGVVRLDLSNGEATVNIAIARECRGKGVATAALRILCERALGSLGLRRLTAQVKPENLASRAAFERAGFTLSHAGAPLLFERPARVRVVAAVQARMGSTRLPGKVLRPVLGRPVLQWLLARLQRARQVDEIVVSTSSAPADTAIEELARSLGFRCFRGSEDDVLGRLRDTARTFEAGALVRITGDCLLVDPAVVDRVVCAFREATAAVEYVCNVYPSTFPHGLDVEVFSRGLLERLDREVDDPFYRDWFSCFVREHPEKFGILNVTSEVDLHELRWTVDYPEDLAFVEGVLRRLRDQGECFGMGEILSLLQRHPELREINRHLEDREVVRGIRSATYHRLLAERARSGLS